MTIQEFRERMATGEPIVGGSELHMEFHKYSQEALRITAEINSKYHTPEELRRLGRQSLKECTLDKYTMYEETKYQVPIS